MSEAMSEAQQNEAQPEGVSEEQKPQAKVGERGNGSDRLSRYKLDAAPPVISQARDGGFDVKVEIRLWQSEYDKASIIADINGTRVDRFIESALMHGGMSVPHGYQELRLTQLAKKWAEQVGPDGWPKDWADYETVPWNEAKKALSEIADELPRLLSPRITNIGGIAHGDAVLNAVHRAFMQGFDDDGRMQKNPLNTLMDLFCI